MAKSCRLHFRCGLVASPHGAATRERIARRGAHHLTLCEGCRSLDVRRLHWKDLLRRALWFDWSWTRNKEPAGNIGILTENDAIVLIYRSRPYGATEWKDIRQRVLITWTECHLGGRRPWFKCTVYAHGRYCRRWVATIYHAGDVFPCQHRLGLAYGSQQEPLGERGFATARKIRMGLGGGEMNERIPRSEAPEVRGAYVEQCMKDRGFPN
jgi:hypothetical protein